jgi:hypothetical protein
VEVEVKVTTGDAWIRARAWRDVRYEQQQLHQYRQHRQQRQQIGQLEQIEKPAALPKMCVHVVVVSVADDLSDLDDPNFHPSLSAALPPSPLFTLELQNLCPGSLPPTAANSSSGSGSSGSSSGSSSSSSSGGGSSGNGDSSSSGDEGLHDTIPPCPGQLNASHLFYHTYSVPLRNTHPQPYSLDTSGRVLSDYLLPGSTNVYRIGCDAWEPTPLNLANDPGEWVLLIEVVLWIRVSGCYQ